MRESLFVGRVQKLRRVVIPRGVYEALRLNTGDKVEIVIRKVEDDGVDPSGS
jgi:bifunctional DNA-binding transcriptional regulator/antitoxin component of YhaV-PrlF toxin-antitoxin module